MRSKSKKAGKIAAVKQKNFGKKDIEHLAKLSRIDVEEASVEKYVDQLGEVLGFVGKLSELDLDDVPETNQVTGLVNVMTEDVISESLGHDEVMSQVPDKHNGYVLVEAIFGESHE